MKKALIAAALATLAASDALAQSSVTIYGRLNASLEQQRNITANASVKALQDNASRLGLKGTEDLGGGLKAGFQLEHGFNLDDGRPAGAFWGRQSEVNLSGGFGTLRLGSFASEAYFATADYVSLHNHESGTSEDKLYARVSNSNNKIAYRLPEMVKGLSIEGAVTAGEGAPGVNKTADFAASYNTGPLHLGLGYGKNGSANQFAVSSLYELGALVLGGYVQKDEDGRGTNFGSRTSFRVSAAYTMGPSEFHVNFGSAGAYSRVANSKASQLTLAYNHKLSKRTKLFGFFTTVQNGTGLTYFGSGAGRDASALAAGVRHDF